MSFVYNPHTGHRVRRGSRVFNELVAEEMLKPTYYPVHRRRRRSSQNHRRRSSKSRSRSGSRRRRSSSVTRVKVPGFRKSLRMGRPSPAQSATTVPVGTVKEGQDGTFWVVRRNSAGVQQWRRT
jgi:hypothetical protein